MLKLKVSDWTITPGPRYKKLGDFSGEEYRDTILVPKMEGAIESKEKLHIDLDGTLGYASSFLDEAFGGLVFKNGFKIGEVLSTLVFISPARPWLINEIQECIIQA